MSFLITNPGDAEAAVSLEHIDGSADVGAVGVDHRAAGKIGRLSIARARDHATSASASGAGLRLVSNLPVTVAQIESDDSNENALSTSGTMLLPAHVLGCTTGCSRTRSSRRPTSTRWREARAGRRAC